MRTWAQKTSSGDDEIGSNSINTVWYAEKWSYVKLKICILDDRRDSEEESVCNSVMKMEDGVAHCCLTHWIGRGRDLSSGKLGWRKEIIV
jgi:hypothetical protein